MIEGKNVNVIFFLPYVTFLGEPRQMKSSITTTANLVLTYV
jgi:hypothetical protein